MFATNRAADGAGLAAPQVGVDLAVFVFDCLDAQWERHVGLVCNPSVTFAERTRRRFVEELDEGCLSLPGAYAPGGPVPDYAICRGQDQFGDDIELVGTGTLARCLQHERRTTSTDSCLNLDFLVARAKRFTHGMSVPRGAIALIGPSHERSSSGLRQAVRIERARPRANSSKYVGHGVDIQKETSRRVNSYPDRLWRMDRVWS